MSEEVVANAPVKDNAPAEAPKSVEATESLVEMFRSKAPEGAKMGWLDNMKDDDSLVKTAFAAQSLIGKKGDIPAEDADDATKAEFWKKLGSDELDIALPEFGEEFGDTAQGLTEYYGGIKDKVLEIAKDVIPKSGNVNEMLGGIINEFVKQDAEASRLGELETRTQIEEATKNVAAKAGITVEQLQSQNKEVLDRYGWGNETQISEMLLTLAKETSNMNTLKEAHLNNTAEGLDAQIAEISASDNYLRAEGPQHDLAVNKLKDLWKKKLDIENRG